MDFEEPSSFDEQNYPNHRASDVIVKEGEDQVVVGRFMYGPLDWETSPGGEVEICVMQNSEWKLIGVAKIDDKGTVTYKIPQEKAFAYGMHKMRMTVKFWQGKGYLIVYVTGRPDMQLQKVRSWLSQHNFPEGMLSVADSYAPDPLGHKAYFLRNLIMRHEVVIRAAYSNSKDIGIFSSINLKPNEIFIVGEVSRKQGNLVDALGEDYRDHKDKLESNVTHKLEVLAPEIIQ